MSQKILWSLDPFQIHPQVFKRSVELLNHLAGQKFRPIEPVYVASPAEVRLNLEFSIPEKQRYAEVAEQEFKKILKNVSITGLKTPAILFENHLRLAASAITLAKYAKKSMAKLIVVGTQAKTGLNRLLLGSFADALLYHVETPVILVSPRTKKIKRLSRWIFPTDFSPQSKKALKRLIPLIKQSGASLFLYHVLIEPISWMAVPSSLSGYGLLPPNATLIDERLRHAQRTGDAWLKNLREQRIQAEFIVEKSSRDIAEATLARAQKLKADAIAMATHSGKLSAKLLGSVARNILHESLLPVYIDRA